MPDGQLLNAGHSAPGASTGKRRTATVGRGCTENPPIPDSTQKSHSDRNGPRGPRATSPHMVHSVASNRPWCAVVGLRLLLLLYFNGITRRPGPREHRQERGLPATVPATHQQEVVGLALPPHFLPSGCESPTEDPEVSGDWDCRRGGRRPRLAGGVGDLQATPSTDPRDIEAAASFIDGTNRRAQGKGSGSERAVHGAGAGHVEGLWQHHKEGRMRPHPAQP